MARMRKRFLDCSNMTMEEAESWGKELAQTQRDIMFWMGDLARYAETRWPDNHFQIWPDWVSPGMISRAAGVARAYPSEQERQHEATYSQYMQQAKKPDRQERLSEVVDKGLTTDESRKVEQVERSERWLLAIDVNYFLHRFWFSGAGIESAVSVATWIQRTVERLKEKGLTDVACCFDSHRNDRKELTKEWEDKYKDRPPKDPELGQQLSLVHDLLSGRGFACVSVDGMEGDDVMASYAKQFDGRITLMTQDKDCRQCLSSKCNILLDVTWIQDETSGDHLPEYKWLSAKQHTEATGIRPDQWTAYQAIMGDNCDGIKGAAGIGEKGAADLIKAFGSVEGAIEAAKADDDRIKPKKCAALIEFEDKKDITLQLVTLRTDLQLPASTRL
jgi:5'-3' exonuclease